MNGRHRYNEDDIDLHDLHSSSGRDREISLGTATILGIFLALALLCAVFFAFGYSLGRRSTPPASAVPEAAAPLSSNAAKPSPGYPTASSKQTSDTPDESSTAADQTDQQADISTHTPIPTAKPVTLGTRSNAPAPSIKPAVSQVALTRSAAPAPAAIAVTGTILVQVAAVSHQDDADVLLSALKKKGYSVAIHHEPQDKLLHIQIGPFASKKDADAMRQRLLSDGYNAIVK